MGIVYRPQIGGLDAVSLVTINTPANGLTIDSNQVLSLALASTSTTGALSSTDWNTFNNKQPSGNYITALTGDGTASGPGSVALTLATVNSNVGSFGSASSVSTFTVNAKGLTTAAGSTSIQIAESQVTNLVSDLAGKQAVGNYITALTGDATASGPGSVALTLATVNSNVGSFGSASSVATFTVNAKGLTTAAASTSIQIAESQVTNLVTDLAAKQALSTITTKGDLYAGTGSATTTRQAVGTNGQVLQSDSSQSTGLSWANNNASTRREWILNPNALVNISGYATFADPAQSTPTDGTGGSPTVTLARNTSSPLDAAADFLFTKDAANRQGEGFSYDFTIDSAYQGTVQQFTFNYKIASGTYASGDMTLWIYDKTNAVLLPQPSGNSIISTSIPSQQGQCTFQTSINSTSYRAIWFVTTTSASAYTVQFGNISVGPQINASGSVDTGWAAYTPTFTGFGTPTGTDFKWRREGPDVIIEGRATSGTMTGTEARISLPSGVMAASDYTTLQLVGKLNAASDSSTYFSGNTVVIEPSVTYMTFGRESSTTNGISKLNGNALISDSVVFSLFARIRVAGWGSNTVLSISANTRLVDFRAIKNGGAITADTTIPSWTTVSKDSVAGFNSSTGVYTVQVPGDYLVLFNLETTASSGSAAIRLNGTVMALSNNAAVVNKNVSTLLTGLVIGDQITGTQGANLTVASTTNTNLSIYMLQGPQQIAASERIAFSATTSNTAATTSSPFVFSAKVYDTHNAYSTSTGVFTAPAPGYYHFTAGIVSTSASNNMQIYVNGSLKYVGSGFSSSALGFIVADLQLSSGDTVDIRPSGNSTSNNSATSNYFSGFRIGGI
jgi:hypothetical protein